MENFGSLYDAQLSVVDGTYSLVILFPPNFENNILAALSSTSYYNQTVYSIIDEGRQSSIASVVRSIRTGLYYSININIAGIALNAMKLSGLALSGANLAAIYWPMTLTIENNNHPLPLSGANLATGFLFTMLFVYAIITLTTLDSLCAPLLKTFLPGDLLRMRMIWVLAIPFILALAPASIFYIFGGTMQYGFVAYWMLIFLVLSVYTSIVLMFFYMGAIGSIGQAIFLMLNIATSDVLVPVTLSPSFYLLGNALPMYNAVQLSRTIVLGTQIPNWIGRNIGVLIGWFILSKILTIVVAQKNDYWQKAKLHQQILRYHLEKLPESSDSACVSSDRI